MVAVCVGVHLLEDGGDVSKDGCIQQCCKQEITEQMSGRKQQNYKLTLLNNMRRATYCFSKLLGIAGIFVHMGIFTSFTFPSILVQNAAYLDINIIIY